MAQEGQRMVVAVVHREPQMIVMLSEDLVFLLLKIVVAVRRGLVPLENNVNVEMSLCQIQSSNLIT